MCRLADVDDQVTVSFVDWVLLLCLCSKEDLAVHPHDVCLSFHPDLYRSLFHILAVEVDAVEEIDEVVIAAAAATVSVVDGVGENDVFRVVVSAVDGVRENTVVRAMVSVVDGVRENNVVRAMVSAVDDVGENNVGSVIVVEEMLAARESSLVLVYRRIKSHAGDDSHSLLDEVVDVKGEYVQDTVQRTRSKQVSHVADVVTTKASVSMMLLVVYQCRNYVFRLSQALCQNCVLGLSLAWWLNCVLVFLPIVWLH
jgi:hypothetical protein